MPARSNVAARIALPSELWSLVSYFLDNGDLFSLAVTHSFFNRITTPTLYSSVHLHHFPQLLAFLTTILGDHEAPPLGALKTHARGLSHLVHTLNTCSLAFNDLPGSLTSLEGFARAISVMSNLRMLIMPTIFTCADKVLRTLFTNDYLMLRAVHIGVSSMVEDCISSSDCDIDSISSRLPALQHLSLNFLMYPSSPHNACIRDITVALAPQLKTFHLPRTMDNVLPPTPALHYFGVNLHAVRDSALAMLQTIRNTSSWGVGYADTSPSSAAVPAHHQPTPELLAFLTSHPVPAIPICVARLGDSTRIPGWCKGRTCTSKPSRWDLILSMQAVEDMAPEVRGLGIAIMELGVAELAAGRLAWAMLEELVIITWTRPGMDVLRAFGPIVLARAPFLHTLLISCEEEKPRAQLLQEVEQQRMLLSEFDMYARAGRLRRVAFTAEFEWERDKEGKWSIPGI